jgi:hypothetical protein
MRRRAYAHEAVLWMAAGDDERAPGAAVTAALCGRWDHERPCPLAPHFIDAVRDDTEVRLPILFATEPDDEPEVRHRIDLALSGQWKPPGGLPAGWELRGSAPAAVRPAECAHADRLARS